jgi:hypothetical protein
MLVEADTVCNAAVKLCENDAKCDGISGICPANPPKSGSLCRESAGECDVAETCDGTSNDCPEDKYLEDGSFCIGDGEPWTVYSCESGICVGETVIPDLDTDDSDDTDDDLSDEVLTESDDTDDYDDMSDFDDMNEMKADFEN